MKSNIFFFTGIGFLGLNLLKNFIHYNCKLIGIKKKFPFKFKIIKENDYYFKSNIFNITYLKTLELENSIVLLSILEFKNKLFRNKFYKLIKFLKEKKIKKLILISSVSVYQNKNCKKKVINEYSKKCLFAEKVCLKFFNKSIILRVSNLYGILRPYPGTIEKITMEYLNIKKFLFYKKNMIRTYISINDFSRILKKIIKIENLSGVYNISNRNLIFSAKKLEDIFAKKFKKKLFFKKSNLSPIIINSIIRSKKLFKEIKFDKFSKFIFDLNKIEKFYKDYYINGKTFIIR